MKLEWSTTGNWDEYECVRHEALPQWVDDRLGIDVYATVIIYNELNTDYRVCRVQLNCAGRSYGYESNRSLTAVVAWIADKLTSLGYNTTFEEAMP